MKENIHPFKITYCITCGFKSRADELKSELEKRFAADVQLVEEHGGLFEVDYNAMTLFSKNREERFPEPGEISNIVSALQDGNSLEAAQSLAKDLIPKPPTFEEWYLKNKPPDK